VLVNAVAVGTQVPDGRVDAQVVVTTVVVVGGDVVKEVVDVVSTLCVTI
jgi:hypothetical protein